MNRERRNGPGASRQVVLMGAVAVLLMSPAVWGQAPKAKTAAGAPRAPRPKLVVMIVVDQMRGDYVDKFRGQWTGGLKRLLDEGAWFRAAAYPYATTETCVGHATISTGAFPANHGMVSNSWWDRDTQKMVTCTADPNVENTAYAGGATKGGDSAWRMQVPAYAEELKFQNGGTARVVTFSLKARASITLAGHKADAATWFDTSTGAWVTSTVYGRAPFVEEFIKKHPLAEDYGKTWTLSLPESGYQYKENALGAAAVEGWGASFPHALHGKEGSSGPDTVFFDEWETSPFADTYLTKMAETAVDALSLGRGGATDFLGVSYSSVDHVGHTFGPHSWEIQDMLVRLDKDLSELFDYLDQKVGKGNYVVAFSSDHGVAPNLLDMQTTGADTGVLRLPELKERLERALEPAIYAKPFAKPAVARMVGTNVYFSKGVYEQLKQDPAAMKALLNSASSMPGVTAVYRAEELRPGSESLAQTQNAMALSYFPGRSGDLFVVQKPYWLFDSSAEGGKRFLGASHGTPYNYDQHVPIFFMGYGIQPGEYFENVTPADIAPTLAVLTGVTLATRDGRVLSEALQKRGGK